MFNQVYYCSNRHQETAHGSGKMMCATVNALCSSASGFIHFVIIKLDKTDPYIANLYFLF